MSTTAVSRLAVILSMAVIAGCGAARTATPSAASPSTPLATLTQEPAVQPTIAQTTAPTSTALSWPAGITAHPAGQDATLGYLAYLPQGYGDGPPPPMLVFLHGFSENGDGSEAALTKVLKNGIPRLIAAGQWPSERPFVVLMPQYPRSRADRCDFGKELDRFIEFAIDRYDIDESRVYLTGISCGAIGIYDYLAQAETNEVAAAVPISGHMMWAIEKAGCDTARVPLWVFHGALDDTVPVHFVQEQVDELRSCTDPAAHELKLTVYPDADHDAWTRTYDLSAGNDVYTWLLGHQGPA